MSALQQERDAALRELADAHRAWRRANESLGFAGISSLPLDEFHRLQDAQHTVREVAASLYPEGT